MLNIARNIYWKPDQQILSLPNLKIIYLLLDISYTFRCYLIRNRARLFNGNYTSLENLSSGIEKKVELKSILYNPDYCWQYKFFFQDLTYWDVIDISGFYFHCETVQSNGPQLRQPKKWYYIKDKYGTYCWRTVKKIHIITLLEGLCTMVFNLIVIITTLTLYRSSHTKSD
jgi:hypothetical protein